MFTSFLSRDYIHVHIYIYVDTLLLLVEVEREGEEGVASGDFGMFRSPKRSAPPNRETAPAGFFFLK